MLIINNLLSLIRASYKYHFKIQSKQMPPKKGAAAAKPGEEEDVSCDSFMKNYRKNCTTLETPQSNSIKQMYEEYVEEGNPISRIHTWETLGWQGTKAIMDALLLVEYKHCTSIRLWKGKCQD